MSGEEQGGPGTAAVLDWREGGIPVSTRFDDPYFSLDGGLEETRAVFLAGNGLPGRLRDGFRIAELGFGTGLNLLTTALAWDPRRGQVQYTSFEAFPMEAEDMGQALAAFPETAPLRQALLEPWAAGHRVIDLPGVTARIIAGDARVTLPQWSGLADAWYLDGFAPAKNPEMWGADLMEAVARHTAPGGTFATYTAAGHVRAALAAAGFAVERRPGFGRKRHMTVGVLQA